MGKRCQKIDLFSIIGMQGQSYRDALNCVNFPRNFLPVKVRIGLSCKSRSLCCSICFGPGNSVDKDTAKFGYNKLWENLKNYRRALVVNSWKYMLNYETMCMSRNEIVEAW